MRFQARGITGQMRDQVGISMRLNVWQRLWFVLAVMMIAAVVRYQMHEHEQYEAAAWKIHADTIKELQNPACQHFAGDPWNQSWRDLSFDLPCYTLVVMRSFVPNHAPLTEASVSARRDKDSSESFRTHLQAGIGIGSLLSALLYVFGWIASKTVKWLAGVLKPRDQS